MKRATRYIGILIFVVVALLFLMIPERKTEASVYKAFNYQGKLLDNAGIAVADGSYSITFLIYDDLAAGSCLWSARGTCGSPTAKTIAVAGGIFSTMLGEAGDNALPDFTSDSYFLEIRIDYGGSPQTLSPRKRIGSVPQALNANALVGDGVINLTSSATTTNAAAITVNSLTTGNGLSISSTSLSSGALINLSVNSTAATSNTQQGLNISLAGANGTAGQTTYGGYITNTHTGTTSTNVGLYVSASGATNNYGLIVADGNVGIGSTSPGAKLGITPGSTVGDEAINVNNEFLVKKVSASGYRIMGRGFNTISAVDSTGFGLLTSGNAAQFLNAKGIFLGTSYSGATADAGEIRTAAATSLTFSPAGSVAMTILSGGDAGIGTASPSHKLHIVDTNTTASRAGLYVSQTGAITGTGYGGYFSKTGASTTNVGLYSIASGATNNYAAIFAAGNVGIGTTTPTEELDVDGDGWIQHQLYARATKDVVATVSSADETIYVDVSAGSDVTGDGTVGLPYATITRAVQDVPDMLMHDYTIQLVAGTYREQIVINKSGSTIESDGTAATLKIKGNGADPDSYRITGSDIGADTTPVRNFGIIADGPFEVIVEGVLINYTKVSGIIGIKSWVNIKNVNFNITNSTNTGGAIYGDKQALIDFRSGGTINITGNGDTSADIGIYFTAGAGGWLIADSSVTINIAEVKHGIYSMASIAGHFQNADLNISNATKQTDTIGVSLTQSDAIHGVDLSVTNFDVGVSVGNGSYLDLDTSTFDNINTAVIAGTNSSMDIDATTFTSVTKKYNVMTGAVVDASGEATTAKVLQNLSGASSVTDSVSAVAFDLDTVNSLATSGALLMSLKNAGVQKFSVSKDGTGYFASDIQLAQISAPSPTTDKLYNVSGNLYWNGVNLSAGGALPTGTSGQTLRHNGTSWTANSVLTNDGTSLAVTSTNTTGTTTTSALALSANSLTTGTGLYVASSTLSSGSLVDLAVTGTAATSSTQKVLNISTSGANGTATQTTYGGYITNTHTGTTSTNVGLYSTASGAANNYSAIFDAGNVGVGTTTPTYQLETSKTIKAGTAMYANTRALDFDGNNDYVNLGNITELNSVANFTVSTWVKQDVVPAADVIFRKYVDNDNDVFIYTTTASNRLYVELGNTANTSGYLTNYNNYMTAGRWHHIAVVYDGAGVTDADKIKLYIDGTYVAFTSIAGIPNTTADLAAANAYIGYSITSWDGQIQDFRIYSFSVAASDIATIYQGGTYTTNMVHQYKLMEGSGAVTTDTGSNPLNGSISGATWSTTNNVGIQTDFGRGTLTLAPNTTNAKDGLWFGYENPMYRVGTGEVAADFKLSLADGITSPTTSTYGLTFGGATAGTADVNLYRSAANVLKTDDSLVIEGDPTDASSTALWVNNAGVVVGTGYGAQILKGGASTTNVGIYTSATGGTTNYGVQVAAMTGNTNVGYWTGEFSGNTANTGIIINAMSGAGTAIALNTGNISSTGATAYHLNLGTISGANAAAHTGITLGNISGTTPLAKGLSLGTLTGGTTSNYQINTGILTKVASATNAQLNLGAVSGDAISSTNYGINIGAVSGTGTVNYGLYVGAVSGATANYGAIFADGNVGIGTTTPTYQLETSKTVKAGTAMYANTRALDFDGNNDYVNAGRITELDSVATFTLSTWVKQDVVPETDFLFQKYVSTANRVRVSTYVTGPLNVYVDNGSSTPVAQLASYSNYITAGRWHHIAVVYDGGGATNADKIKLYIDGVYVAFSSFAGTIPTTTGDLSSADAYIGTTSSSWDGQIQDFRIYSSSVADSDIATIYQGGTYTTNMVHQYKLMEGSGLVATDTGSNVLNGIIVGATWGSTGNTGIQTDFGRGALTLAPNTTNAKDGLWFGYDVNLYRSGAGTLTTANMLTIGANSTIGANANQFDIGAISGANATSHAAINVGNISGTTPIASGINLGTLTGGTTSNYQLNTGIVTKVASATNAQINLGAVSGDATSSTNYGINVGAVSGTGTANYGLYLGAVAGATTNYSMYAAGGDAYFADNVTIANAKSYTGAGTVTLSSATASALTIDSGTTGAVDIGTGANAKTLTIGNVTTATALVFNTGTGGITMNLIDNDSDQVDVRQGSDNYLNINTTNTSEAISFGNATTNPTFYFVGSGNVGVGLSSGTAAKFHVSQATLGSEAFRIESVATNDDPNYRMFQNRVTTADATQTTLFTINVTNANIYMFEARVTAHDLGATVGNSATYVRRASFIDTGLGGLVQVGSTQDTYTAEMDADWDCTFTTTGASTVKVSVTGKAATDIVWHSTVIVQNTKE